MTLQKWIYKIRDTKEKQKKKSDREEKIKKRKYIRGGNGKYERIFNCIIAVCERERCQRIPSGKILWI